MIVPGETLRRFADDVLRAMGAPADVAAEVATHLVRANLSGHEALGVGRLPDYAGRAERGELIPSARCRLVRETPAAGLFDACGGFGQHATAVALDWCVERCRETGVAAAAVRGTCEVGRLAEYAERAAEAGVLALVTAGSAGTDAGDTVFHGSRQRFFGANTWAFAAPGRARSLTFESSTSTIRASEVLLARAKGEPLPPDCLLDRFGRPSTDPDDLAAGGGLVPLGGTVAGHKGSGLALASAMFGSLAGGPAGAETIGGVFVQAIDPAAFGDPDGYRAGVEATLAAARAVRPVAGRTEVLLPGDLEARLRTQRGRTGVRLPDTTWAELTALAARLGVKPTG